MSKSETNIRHASYEEIEELSFSFGGPPLPHNAKQEKFVENPLITAILSNDDAAFNQALADKENIEKLSKIGYSPLHVAVSDGKREYVKLLVENKANINALISGTIATPLNIAIGTEQVEIVKYLLIVGAKPCEWDFALAQHNNNSEIIQTLEQYKSSELVGCESPSDS